MREYRNITCKYCLIEVTTKWDRQIYCSSTCRDRHAYLKRKAHKRKPQNSDELLYTVTMPDNFGVQTQPMSLEETPHQQAIVNYLLQGKQIKRFPYMPAEDSINHVHGHYWSQTQQETFDHGWEHDQ